MIEYYPQIKLLHVLCVLLSGGLFASRGLLMLANSSWTNHPSLKWPSYIKDSILLTAGLVLMQITQQYPVANNWLTVKLLMLLAYVVLGVFALRAGRTKKQRTAFLIVALMVYLFIISVARTHNPLGIFATMAVF